MLSPSNRVTLLPCDREIMELAGLTEPEYREFVRRCRFESRVRPGDPVALDPVTLGLILVGVGALTYTAGVLLSPKPKTQNNNRAAEARQSNIDGQDIVSQPRYAPKAGFDSLQNVVELGSTIPLVYARREVVNGQSYGGVRINTNLVWSQVLSLGGDQLLRGLFLVGEGDSRANSMEIDATQCAFGNNLLGAYDLSVNQRSRVTIYYSNDGGRIVDTDYLAGNPAATDPGNFGSDVFSVGGTGNLQGPNFCFAAKPSTQTSIGLYSWLGNGFGFRVNPSLRPEESPSLRPAGSNTTDSIVVCNLDPQERAYRLKMQAVNPCRSGLTTGGTALAVGDIIRYEINSAVSRAGNYTANGGGQGAANAVVQPTDINQAVASRQVSFDEALTEGELYKIGSALAICTRRDDTSFNSAANGAGVSVTADFEIVRAGAMTSAPGTGAASNATATSQIFRVARGVFTTEYPCQVLELGLRSSLGISINGLTNTIDAGYIYDTIDGEACAFFNGLRLTSGQVLNTQNRVAGQVSTNEQRYSFFRVRYREAGSNGAYTDLDNIYGARSETQQPIYSFIRFEMPVTRRWEFEIEPLSGWEIRSNTATGTLYIIDPRMPEIDVLDTARVRFNGQAIARNRASFAIQFLDPLETALEPDSGGAFDQSMADPWAKLAEAFVYNEVTTSVSGNPEWEIVYINTIMPNTVAPNYDNLALLGMNIRASREFSNLSQFSVYMNRGLGGFHDFPSVLNDMLTSTQYGLGEIISPTQIDTAAFAAATVFTNARNYYFDGAITSPINIRQWASSVARNFLLDLIIRNGKWSLQPTVEFDKPEPITALFTAGNIVEDSFELNYLEQDQRQAPRISVKWRQEQTSGDLNNRGLFPIVREVTVRESTTSADAPIESIDISDYGTSQKHAIDRAKFECRFRRLSTHQIRFKTTVDQAVLDLGKCFKLGMETVIYNQPSNGYISEQGELTSWPELADGNYPALVWDGKGTAIAEVTLTIAGGKCATNLGSVFCLKNSVSDTQTYKVTSLSFDEDGNVDVEAIHWPTGSSGYSLISANFDNSSSWIVEGEI